MLRSLVLLIAGAGLAFVAAPSSAQDWQPEPSMGTPRTGAASAVFDGRLYVVGGRSLGGARLATAEVFTPGTGWTPIASLDEPRADARLVVFQGRLYLLGGSDDEATDDVAVYRPDQNRWDDADEDLDRDRDGVAAGVVGGTLFVLGGSDDGYLWETSERLTSDDWEIYSAWPVDPGRALAGSVSTGDAIILAGGFSQFGPLDAVERFVPGMGPVALPALPSARGGLALVTTGGRLVAVGGRDVADVPIASVDLLAGGAGSWTALTPLPEARASAVAAVLNGDLYVAGGTDAFGSVLATMVRLPGAGTPDEAAPGASVLALTLDGPNPSRGHVRIALVLPRPATVRVEVVDVQGRRVATLADGARASGRHALAWDASGLPAGVYAVRATVGADATTLRVTTVR